MTTIILRNPKKGSRCYINKENNKFFLYAWDGTLTQVGEFTDTEKAITSLLNKGWVKKGDKKMKEQLLDRMIRIYGFEHEAVIAFAELIENDTFTDEMLETIVKAHEEHPVIEEED